MKLASKIVLLCLLAMAAMSCLFSYLTIQRDARRFADEHSRNASELARVIKPTILAAAHIDNPDELAEAVENCSVEFQHVTVRYVRFDEEADKSREPAAPRHLLTDVLEKEQLTVTATDKDGNQNVLTYIPVGQLPTSGGLEVARPMRANDLQTRHTIWNSTLALMGAALLSALVVVVGGVRMIGEPLEALIQKTKRVGQGDFGEPVDIRGNTELSQLGSAINDMCDQLATQQVTIVAEAQSRFRTEQQLRHADRLRTVGQLAAGVAHEIGTPLNVVAGRAGLIAAGKLADDEIRESAHTIKAETDRISKVIRGLLDFARRDSPISQVENVKTIVEATVDLLDSFAEKENVTIVVTGDSDAADGRSFEANADAGQLQQVFANLIMNSIQSIERQGRIDVRLSQVDATPNFNEGGDSLAPEGKYVRVDVKDTGRGIPVADQPHIFEPFFTTKDIGEGTGLGLSISYGIIRDHHGWIEVASTPGRGSCFSVFIPFVLPTDTLNSN